MFGWILTAEQIPVRAATIISMIVPNKIAAILLVNLLFLDYLGKLLSQLLYVSYNNYGQQQALNNYRFLELGELRHGKMLLNLFFWVPLLSKLQLRSWNMVIGSLMTLLMV